MARAIWTGSVSFGLVNVAVGLYTATEDHTVHFSQFEKGTADRIRYRRVNEQTGEEVDYSDIVKGYDIGGGDYVIVTPEELDEIAPGRSRTIDITDFVYQSEIDPIHYQKTYYLAPQGDDAERPYGLLLEAMRRADRVGIATFVMRGKQYLAAIRPHRNVLALETMFFADEIRDPAEELDSLPSDRQLHGREVDMAVSLVDSMTVAWKPGNYGDTYRDRAMEMIEAKRRGEEIISEEDVGESGTVIDLMQALERSLETAKGKRPGNVGEAPKPGTRRAGSDAGRGSDRNRGPGGKAGTRRAGSGDGDGDGGGDDDLAGMAREDLYQLAKQLDVPGRSKMKRDQLVTAVRDATGGRRRAS